MNFKFAENNDNLIKLVFSDENINPFFKADKNEILPSLEDNLILLGLGNRDDFSEEVLKVSFSKLSKFLKDKKIKSISIGENNTPLSDEEFLLKVAEGIILGEYDFDFYKSDKKEIHIKDVYFDKSLSIYEDKLKELELVLEGQFFARNLVNLRSNDIYPETLAKACLDKLSPLGVDVKVYSKDQILDMGLTAFYEVSKGSDKDPRFIVMEYLKADDKEDITALVGKGLTYDAGGYLIKSSNGMKTMNSDMGGAGTVIGAMYAISKAKLKKNVVAIVAACENLISGNSYKPGDIIKARNGKTIDVDNTDAEGRITLADAVNYAATEYKPSLLIDLATLTGAALGALGETYTPAITNDKKAFEKVYKACKKSDEKIWLMPNDPFFKSYNESENADVKNSGGPLAGSITAGQFIENFIEDRPWVHLDIAGTAYLSAPQGANPKGATGVHVKTLYNLVKDN